jgi:hypothetical protein
MADDDVRPAAGCPHCTYQEVDQKTFDDLMADIERRKAERAAKLPDEQACIDAAFEAWLRLKELGWNDIIYCPKDGTIFSSISAGSTGIHDTHYQGEWPDGSWWVFDGGDLWPAHPTMWKPKGASASEPRSEAERTQSVPHTPPIRGKETP